MIRNTLTAPRRATLVRVERHLNGPRVYVIGRRIHEFQLGFALIIVAAVLALLGIGPLWASGGCEAGGGLWLVVKDWPDLFPATRDTACWRFGIHRPPVAPWRVGRSQSS